MNEWKSPQYLQKAFPEELKSSVQDTNCLKTSANKSWRVTGERCIIRPTESVPRLVGPSNTVRIWVNKTERLSCLTGRPLKQHATSPWPEQHQALGTDQFYIRDEKEYMFLMGFCSGANQSHKAASVWLLHIKVTFPIKAFVLRHKPWSILGMIIKVDTQTIYVSITF